LSPWKLSGRIASLLVAAILTLGAAEGTAQAVSAAGLEWTWEEGETRRWFVDAEVQLPASMLLWVLADRNKEARLVAFRTRSVLACTDMGRNSRRSREVHCLIEDIAIMGATLKGDRGLLQPILEEMDDKLTDSYLQLIVRNDGRIVNLDLEGIQTTERRHGRMQETLRLMMARSVAGFDLQLPRKGLTVEGVWPQYQAMLFTAPSGHGTQGSAEIAHLIRTTQGDYVIIESAGRAIVSPGTDSTARDYFQTTLDSVAVFDVEEGMLRERVWASKGTPTASSATAEGARGIDYIQQGKILYLAEGTAPPTLGETIEIGPSDPEVDSSVLLQSDGLLR
jgi:hypothetical protein